MQSFPSTEPVHCSMSSSYCCFLTCIQVSQEAGRMVWYSYLFKNFPQFIVIRHSKRLYHSQWSKSICFSGILLLFLWSNECWEFDLWFLCLSKSSSNIWKFMVHVLLKPDLENFEHYFTSVWDECNCAAFWTFFSIAFLWDWNEKWFFSSPVTTGAFSKFSRMLSAALS